MIYHKIMCGILNIHSKLGELRYRVLYAYSAYKKARSNYMNALLDDDESYPSVNNKHQS